MDSNLIKLFLEQATAKGSKSTVLKPLYVMMAVCIAATFATFHFSFPVWCSYFFAFFTFATMTIYLVSYMYCLSKNPDSLRSETYSIQKLAIQKGFVGDSTSGVVPLERGIQNAVIGHSAAVNSEDVK